VRVDLPAPELADGLIRATVLYVDRYGNTQLNLTREHLEQVGLQSGTRVELEAGGERYFAVVARTFADARAGDIVLYEDSYRNVAIAINKGSAAALLGLAGGQEIALRIP
jgi:hypothetical protein